MSVSDLSLHQAVDMALDFAVIVGFAIPGPGVVVSLGAAAASMLGHLFFPDTEPSEIDALIETGERVTDELVLLQKHVHEALWKEFTEQHKTSVEEAARLHALVSQALFDGTATAADMSATLVADWDGHFAKAKAQCSSTSSLAVAIEWMDLGTNKAHRHQLTPLYGLTASLHLAFCRLALMIETIEIARDVENARKAWRARHPDGQAPDDDPEPRPRARGREQISRSTFHADLANHLPTHLKALEQRTTALRQAFNEVDEAVMLRSQCFVVKESAGRFHYTDSEHDYRSPGFDNRDECELAMTVARSRVLDALEAERRQELDLRNLHADLLPGLEKVIAELHKGAEESGIAMD